MPDPAGLTVSCCVRVGILEVFYRVTLLIAIEPSAKRKSAQWNILKRENAGKKTFHGNSEAHDRLPSPDRPFYKATRHLKDGRINAGPVRTGLAGGE